jgi:signal transduction histidine kinase
MGKEAAISPESDRGVVIRPLAALLFQVYILACILLGWLAQPQSGALVLGSAVLVNLGAFLATRTKDPRWTRWANRVSPLCGILTWATLVHLNGGVQSSVFVAGLWFEVLLSVVCHSPRGVMVIAGLSVASLWIQQGLLGLPGGLGHLSLHSSSLLLAGGALAWIRRSWQRRQESSLQRLRDQQERLAAIEEELQDVQTLAALGERTARLGHGLKNAVHSLRGFSALIERQLDRPNEQQALQGLREAVDQLETLARESLRPTPAAAGERPARPGGEFQPAVGEAVREISRSSPEVEVQVLWEHLPRSLRVPRQVLDEVLTNLLRNALESMDGKGKVTITVRRVEGRVHIQVDDQGPGVAPEMRERIFRPGQTTKPGGHGLGLHLAQQLVEAHGGDLSLLASPSGASFRIAWPEG